MPVELLAFADGKTFIPSPTRTDVVTHTYPLPIQRGTQKSKEEETIREAIRFTAVKQGGVTFKSGDAKKIRDTAIESSNKSIDERVIKALSARGLANINDANLPAREKNELIAAEQKKIDRAQEEKFRLAADPNNVTAFPLLLSTLNLFQKRTSAAQQILEHCFLYMPTSVVYNEGATWGQQALESTGNLAKQLVQGKSDIGSILSEFGTGMAPMLARMAGVGLGAVVGKVFGALAVAVGGGGIVSGIGKAARIVQNPYEEQLFTGIPFRVFNFNFEFIAVSETEYKEVQNIIRMFRAHSRPTFTIDSDLNEDQNESLYSYPNEFLIEFQHLNSEGSYVVNTNLPKIHPCVLTNITTNYAPDGWLAHPKGEPVAIVVQLAFTETKKNTRNDIVKGGY